MTAGLKTKADRSKVLEAGPNAQWRGANCFSYVGRYGGSALGPPQDRLAVPAFSAVVLPASGGGIGCQRQWHGYQHRAPIDLDFCAGKNLDREVQHSLGAHVNKCESVAMDKVCQVLTSVVVKEPVRPDRPWNSSIKLEAIMQMIIGRTTHAPVRATGGGTRAHHR